MNMDGMEEWCMIEVDQRHRITKGKRKGTFAIKTTTKKARTYSAALGLVDKAMGREFVEIRVKYEWKWAQH